jgi:hypothetical protein
VTDERICAKPVLQADAAVLGFRLPVAKLEVEIAEVALGVRLAVGVTDLPREADAVPE